MREAFKGHFIHCLAFEVLSSFILWSLTRRRWFHCLSPCSFCILSLFYSFSHLFRLLLLRHSKSFLNALRRLTFLQNYEKKFFLIVLTSNGWDAILWNENGNKICMKSIKCIFIRFYLYSQRCAMLTLF